MASNDPSRHERDTPFEVAAPKGVAPAEYGHTTGEGPRDVGPPDAGSTTLGPVDAVPGQSLLQECLSATGTSPSTVELPADVLPAAEVPQPPSLTVREVVLQSDASTRLRNAAINGALLSEWTAEQALARPDEFWDELLKLPNVGRTTAYELANLLVSAARDGFVGVEPVKRNEPDSEVPATRSPPPEIDPRFLGISIAEILHFSGCSARLENAIDRAGFDVTSLGEYLADPTIVAQRLRELDGIGRKSSDEAVMTLEAFIVAADNGEASAYDLLAGTSPADIEQEAVQWHARDEPDPRPARTRLEDVVSQLAEKELHVLRERYGLDGSPKRTLQEVAEGVHVTRERIRQVEAKAIRKLGHARHQRLIAEFLRDEQNVIWAALSGGNGLISPTELRETAKSLDPWHLLAIDVAHGGVREWIQAKGVAVGSSWVRPDLDHAHIAETADLLTRLVSAQPQPLPQTTLTQLLGVSGAAADHAIEHTSELQAYEGYVFKGRTGSRIRRLIDLHRIATSIAKNGLFDLATLVADYRRQIPDDGVAPRIFQTQLEEAPHLFCRLHDSIWFALPAAGGTEFASPPYERDAALEPSFEPGSIGAEIAGQLADGPQRHVALRESVPDAVRGRVAASSVGAVLISNPCFRRVSPGIFDVCRTGEVYDENGVLGAVFLNERQCQTYCLARYSGAPMSWYPAWGPSLELWLARWARLEASPELFSSLMYVADVSTWSAPENEMAFWRRTQVHDRAWMIGSERRFRLGRRLLESDQVLPTLAQLAFHGWTSWMAVNRTTDARLDVHDAADVLALLIKAGLVTAPDDWQAPHLATPAARAWLERVCSEMHRNGQLDWEHGSLAELWAAIERNANEPPSGWLDNAEFLDALEAWRSGEARSSRAFARKADEPIDADPIFETDDWDSLFRS